MHLFSERVFINISNPCLLYFQSNWEFRVKLALLFLCLQQLEFPVLELALSLIPFSDKVVRIVEFLLDWSHEGGFEIVRFLVGVERTAEAEGPVRLGGFVGVFGLLSCWPVFQVVVATGELWEREDSVLSRVVTGVLTSFVAEVGLRSVVE